MSSSKRRRVTAEEQEPTQQPALVGSSPTAVEIPISGSEDCNAPQLDQIPQLLIVELQKDTPHDVVAALKRICKLVEANDPDNENDPAVKNWKEMEVLGPISSVVICMLKWPDHNDIQSLACDTLANMVHCAGGIGRIAIAKSGGVEVVVNAMKKFQDLKKTNAVDLQREAIRTLQNAFAIKEGDPKIVSECMVRFVKKLKGVDLVVRIMNNEFVGVPNRTNTDSRNLHLLHSACGLLYNLSCFKENHGSLVKSGAVEAAAAIQKKYYSHEDLRTEAEEFLTKMFNKGA